MMLEEKMLIPVGSRLMSDLADHREEAPAA
jgi:hypothetical protein